MICERCGRPITETHLCTPTLAYLERRILRLERRIERLEKAAGEKEPDDPKSPWSEP